MKKVVIILFLLLVATAIAFQLLRPHFANKIYTEGLALSDSAQYEQAIDKFNTAIWYKKKIANYYNARGIAFAALEQDSLAMEDFDRAIE